MTKKQILLQAFNQIPRTVLGSNFKPQESGKIKITIKELTELINQYQSYSCFHPSKVEEILSISSTERKRWQADNRLKIAYLDHESFKYGAVPMFGAIDIANITSSQIKKWRERDAKKTKKNRKQGAIKARKTRTANDLIRTKQAKELKIMVREIEKLDPSQVIYFELAYWTVFASRWAKYYQHKAWEANNNYLKDKHYSRKDEFYELKNQAIKALLKSLACQTYKYIPKPPQKRHKCQRIYSRWSDDYDYDYDFEPDRYKIKTIKNYYCLYYTTITLDPSNSYSFSFHTPYLIGKELDFPDFFSLPDAPNHQSSLQQEEVLKFGRPILEQEAIAHTAKKVTTKINQIINNIQKS